MAVMVLFQKPEALPPKFPKPEAVPVPELKKPDDGVEVWFPNPGAAGMSRNRVRTGPAPLRMWMGIEVVALPMLRSITGRLPVTCGMVMGPKLKLVIPMALIVIRGRTKPLTKRLLRSMLIGMLIGMSMSKLSTENAGTFISTWVPHRPW